MAMNGFYNYENVSSGSEKKHKISLLSERLLSCHKGFSTFQNQAHLTKSHYFIWQLSFVASRR
jgi:hypothetical protein